MEKSMKHKTADIISFIPKSSIFTHHRGQGGDFSTKTSKNHRPYRRGHSGPMVVSIVPTEARKKAGNGKGEGGFGMEEPTSPTVSCIGQIKQRKKAMKDKYKRQPATPQPLEKIEKKKNKKASSGFHNLFRRKTRPEKGPEAADGGGPTTAMADRIRTPPLGQMKRFASGHEKLGSFDWSKVEAASAEVDCTGDFCYLRGRKSDHDEEEDDVIIIPHSAPIILGAGGAAELEAKKEINLWKRRSTFAPVSPIRLS